eukprot:COSAG05_NODE_3059_length_2374_cov_1.259780_2_plen_82_part_01
MSRDDMLVAELEAEAMSAAERAVRTWLPMMFGAEELQELCTAYGVTPAAPGRLLLHPSCVKRRQRHHLCLKTFCVLSSYVHP